MARRTLISGEIVTVTEVKATDVTGVHWFYVSGTSQGIVDYLNENGIPEHKVKGATLGTGSSNFVLYHK